MPSRTSSPEPDFYFVDSQGNRSDAELHAEMLDDNPHADALFVLDAIAKAVEGGMSQEAAIELFASPRTLVNTVNTNLY